MGVCHIQCMNGLVQQGFLAAHGSVRKCPPRAGTPHTLQPLLLQPAALLPSPAAT